MQGLVWRAINADGTLTYTFVESVRPPYPFYVLPLAGRTCTWTGNGHHAVEHREDAIMEMR